MSTKELSVTRYIDAPPETVWDVMVNRQAEWFCPAPWRAEVDHQAGDAEEDDEDERHQHEGEASVVAATPPGGSKCGQHGAVPMVHGSSS